MTFKSATENFDYDLLTQRIGEFVICFQWTENLIRQIGCLIVDPEHKNSPLLTFINLRNYDLLEDVKIKYCNLMDAINIQDGEGRKLYFKKLINDCHELREIRNNLLHSAYIELKAGDDVVALMRSNPKSANGNLIFDQELLSETSITNKIENLGKTTLKLNLIFSQLRQWAPFSHLKKEVDYNSK